MSEMNNRNSLLLGRPIKIDDIGYIYSPTLNEIESIGLDTYYYYLSLITMKPDKFQSYEDSFDDLIKNKKSQYLLNFIILFFTKENFFYAEEIKSFIFDKKLENGEIEHYRIKRENYMSFVNAVKLINLIKIEKEVKYFNSRAKQMAEKFKELREKYSKTKKDNDLDYNDIISTVSSRHPNINLLNVGDLTIYQLLDKFKRLTNIDEYHTNIQALMNGAKDIELKHYSSKFD